MRPLLFILAAFALAACHSNRDDIEMAEDEGIHHERNSEFAAQYLRVFLNLEDGRPVSVNTLDDAVDTRPAVTPIPGHRARNWTFVKETDDGTSVAHALVSWDPDEPADYLMAGWWAEFPGQHVPNLSFEESAQYAIVDGPEIDPAQPPRLPIEGRASYVGQAGGLYAYVPGTDWGKDEGAYVIDEYEGKLTITADFARSTLGGCIGCEGDLVTRRAHFGIFLGDDVLDVRSIAADYEVHLGTASFDEAGHFENSDVTVKHPQRTITESEGFWGGALSSRPDQDGNPRLVAGFSAADFEENDGSTGSFFGTFVGLSERFRNTGRPQPPDVQIPKR